MQGGGLREMREKNIAQGRHDTLRNVAGLQIGHDDSDTFVFGTLGQQTCG